jgi:plasmid maintenance system antidote protein VapI
MSIWLNPMDATIDVEILEEAALAMAQSTIQNAVNDARITRAELARKMERPRSYITTMLSGRHNLTIKTMARALAACGYEARFQHVPLVWSWKTRVNIQKDEQEPAHAGTAMSADLAGVAVPTFAASAQAGV